jgi:ABC-type sugar transport system ATPase subunit/ribose/xylose/arabinose/galactoside ABC-type transport system permease subunit
MGRLLQLVEITRRFPGVTALDNVSFDLAAGEVHALVGENGAGKSTLINILSGVLQPDRGLFFLLGQPITLSNPVAARRLGIVTVHQEAEMFDALSVAENMALPHGLVTNRFGRIDWRQVSRDARDMVARLGEPIDVWQPASQLSVGHRQMIQVAAAIVRQVKVVILDEPTSALSGRETAWLFDQLKRLSSVGVGIIYVSHRLHEIFSIAQRITVLRDGRRVWTGAKDETNPDELLRAMVGREQFGRPTARAGAVERESGAVRLRVAGFTDPAGRFSNIHLEARAGEIVGVYGLVGAGRTQWAQAVFGLRSASGTIEIDGRRRRIRRPTDARDAGLAYVPEDRLGTGLCRRLGVRFNTVLSTLHAWTKGPLASRKAETSAVTEQVRRLDIRLRDVEQPVCELSGGNQQKVILARWLLASPKVLILDEPTRGVDVRAKREIHRVIRDLADQGCAIVMISSELPEILEHSDRVVVFRGGTVVAELSAQDCSPTAVGTAALPTPAAPALAPSRRRHWPLGSLVWTELGLVAAIIALLIGLAVSTAGQFLARENLVGLADDASGWILLGLGASAVIVAGGIDISVGSLLALAAGAAGLVVGQNTGAVLLGVAIGMTVGLLGGLTNATVALIGRIHPIIVSLGTMTIYRGLLVVLTGGDVVGNVPVAFTKLATGRIFGVPGSLLVALLVAASAAYWLGHTRLGRWVFALGCNPEAARVIGISRTQVWLAAFGFNGACAALAGMLELARNRSMQSVLGTGYELQAIAAAVLGGTAIRGGRASVLGVCLGAVLLTLIRKSLVLWGVPGYLYPLVVGSLLVAAVLLDLSVRKLTR